MEQQLGIFDDITRRRHKGNAESEAAHQRLAPELSNIRAAVLAYAVQNRVVSLRSVMQDLHLSHPTASARLTELKKLEYLEPTEMRDRGCRVLRVTEAGRKAGR